MNSTSKTFLTMAALFNFTTAQAAADPVSIWQESCNKEKFIYKFYQDNGVCNFANQYAPEEVPSKQRCAYIKQTLEENGCAMVLIQADKATQVFLLSLEHGYNDKEFRDLQAAALAEIEKLNKAVYTCVIKAARAEYDAQQNKQ